MTEEQAAGVEHPRDFAALKTLIMDRQATLPKRLAQVADYAMTNPDEIAFGTAASIAANADVQPSTLVRFAQQLGYGGFSELQSVFRERLRQRVPAYRDRLAALRLKPGAKRETPMILEGVSDAASQSLDGLTGLFDADTLETAIKTLAKADTIYLLGQRRSFPVVTYLAYGLGKLGIRNRVVGSESGIDSEIVSFAGRRDAALAISFTPYASATIELAGQMVENRVPLIAITDSPFSPLVPNARAVLEVVEADFEGFRSLTATMVLALTLMIGIVETRENTS